MFEQSSNEIGKQITIGNNAPLSETQSLFSKTKWQWRSPSVDKNGLDNNFNSSARAWSNNHMYRTHYQDMSDKVRILFWVNFISEVRCWKFFYENTVIYFLLCL